MVSTRSSSSSTKPQTPRKAKAVKAKATVTPSPPKKKKKPAVTPTKKILYADDSTPPSTPLLSLDELITARLVNRPSKRNRSPYVADVLVLGKEALCHVPNLDMGGKCIKGSTLLVSPARDRKGNLVGPDAVNPKYGTPKCQYIAKLLRVDETEAGYTPACWVGAHPSLGEKIAESLLLRNLLPLPPIASLQREVRNVAGADMRADFVVEFVDSSRHKPCVLEVKTVVDTDFEEGRIPKDRTKCVFTSPYTNEPYRRAGIFPWGQSNQKGPQGEPVVSARAIKHVQELTRIAQGERKGESGELYQSAVLFIVVRSDAQYFRANHEACPSFAKYLKQAQEAGVTVMAKRVDWGDTPETMGQCMEGPLLDVEWPSFEEEKATTKPKSTQSN